jgi:hypothetical protein
VYGRQAIGVGLVSFLKPPHVAAKQRGRQAEADAHADEQARHA